MITEIHKRLKNNTCKFCDFKTYKNENFQKHLTSKAHQTKAKQNELINGLVQNKVTHIHNNDTKYRCEDCDYETDRQFCYKKHLNTNKHSIKVNGILETSSDLSVTSLNIEHIHKCPFCRNIYSTSSNLTKHKKLCGERDKITTKNLDLAARIIELEKENENYKKNCQQLIQQQQDEIKHLRSLINKFAS